MSETKPRVFEINSNDLTQVMNKVKLERKLRIALDSFLAYKKIHTKQLENINTIARQLNDIKQKDDVWFDNINDEELKKIIKQGWFKQ